MQIKHLLQPLIQSFCFLCISFCSFSGVGQTPLPLQDYFRESFTTRNGLPHNSIYDIEQSGEGYLWLATWEGAARFDGRTFQVFARGEQTGFTDSGVRSLWREADGSILLGGARGSLSEVNQGVWTPQPHVAGLVSDLFRDKTGKLFVATEGFGVQVKLAANQYESLLPKNIEVVYRVLANKAGELWFGTDQGLFHNQQMAVKKVTPEQGLPAGPIYALAFDSANRLLVGGEKGAFRLEQQQMVLVHPQLANVGVNALLNDQHGRLWIGTISDGLYRLSDLGLEHFKVEHGLPNNRVLALFEDQEGTIWVGTNGGLMRLRETPFTAITKAQGLSDGFVRTVLEHSDGSLWIGSSNGLDRVLGKQVEQIRLPDGKPVPSVLSLAEAPNGDIWAGTYDDGVLLFRHGQLVTRYQRADGLASNEVRSIIPASDNLVYFGTSAGLSQLSEKKFKNLTTANGLPSSFVSALMLQIDGTLWIGTGNGLAKMANGNIEPISMAAMDNVRNIFDFSKVPNSTDFWMATDRGIVLHHAKGMDLIGRDQGLPFDKVFSILRQDNQFLWLSSNRGVLRIGQSDVEAVLSGKQTKLMRLDLYGEPDGMPSAQCNGGSTPAAIRRKDGSLWFATALGVVSVDPSRLARFTPSTPNTVVQSIFANGQLQTHTKLAAGTRRVSFEFAGLSYLMPSRIMYRTKLVGFDQDWVHRAHLRSAEYTNLVPGNYQFFVSAAYPDGEWSPPASMAFSIQPFFWQRLEFIIFCFFLTIALIYAAYRWRIIRIRQREMQLAAQVAAQTAALQEQTAVLQEQATQLHLVVAEKTLLAVQLQQQSEAFAQQARQDGLTGLANRRAFDERLAHEFNRAHRLFNSLCMIMLDIDHFKRINDQWSHTAGDAVLIRVADILRQSVRDIDLAARWGGEEFILLLPEASLSDGVKVAERIRRSLAQTDFSDIAVGLKVTASFGVTVNTGYTHYEKMLSQVDSLLYQAKNQGRNQVCS